jgi:hypothetical protein
MPVAAAAPNTLATIADAFAHETTEISERIKRGDRLIGFAIVAVLDAGRTHDIAYVVERHGSGSADEPMREALSAALAEIDGGSGD